MSAFKMEYIFLDVNCSKKLEALNFIAEKTKSLEISNDKEKIYDGLLEREEKFTTNLGEFIAIPHTKNEAVLKPSILVLKFKEPIFWNDGEEKVKLCIILLMPDDSDNNHLKVLASISRKLINKEFKESLLSSNNTTEIFNIINNI